MINFASLFTFSCVVKPVTKCETVMEQDCHSVQEDKCSWEMEQKCLTHPGIFVHYLNSGVVVLKSDFMVGNRKANAL